MAAAHKSPHSVIHTSETAFLLVFLFFYFLFLLFFLLAHYKHIAGSTFTV